MTESNNDPEFNRVLRSLDDERREPTMAGMEPPAPPGGSQSVRISIPLRAGQPWAARVLLALNIVIYALPAVLSSLTGTPWDELVLGLGAKDNRSIFVGGQYYRFLTAMFLHGNLMHIGFNAWALYALGFEAERLYGTARFLAVYFLAGFAGGLASYALNPSPSVGASGAIFGLIGALAAFYFEARGVLGGIARQQLGSLLFVILINIGLGLSTPAIDNNAHIGGLVGGALAGWLLAPRFVVETRTYPPRIDRTYLTVGWLGAAGLLVILGLLATVVRPPL